MYEYEIANVNENRWIFGYSIVDAFRRAKLDSEDWTVINQSYYDMFAD